MLSAAQALFFALNFFGVFGGVEDNTEISPPTFGRVAPWNSRGDFCAPGLGADFCGSRLWGCREMREENPRESAAEAALLCALEIVLKLTL